MNYRFLLSKKETTDATSTLSGIAKYYAWVGATYYRDALQLLSTKIRLIMGAVLIAMMVVLSLATTSVINGFVLTLLIFGLPFMVVNLLGFLNTLLYRSKTALLAVSAVFLFIAATLTQSLSLTVIAALSLLAATVMLVVKTQTNIKPGQSKDKASVYIEKTLNELPLILLDTLAPQRDFKLTYPPRAEFANNHAWEKAKTKLENIAHKQRLTKAHSLLLSVEEPSKGRVIATVRVPTGETDDSLIALAPVLSSALQAYQILENDGDDRAGIVSYEIHYEKQPTALDALLSHTIEPEFFTENNTQSLLEYTAGKKANGEPFHLPLGHSLIYGITGAGKGGLFRTVYSHYASAVNDGLVEMYFCDPKNGEAKPFKKTRAFKKIAFDSNDMADVVDHVYNLLKVRQADDSAGDDITQENPAVILMLDELPSLLTDKVFIARKDEARENMSTKDKLFQILAQGRSGNIFVYAATQYYVKAVLGQLRDNFFVRIALRTESLEASSDFLKVPIEEITLVPAATKANGYKYAGVGYVVQEGEIQGASLIRYGYVSDSLISEIDESLYGPREAAPPTRKPRALPPLPTLPAIQSLPDKRKVISKSDKALVSESSALTPEEEATLLNSLLGD